MPVDGAHVCEGTLSVGHCSPGLSLPVCCNSLSSSLIPDSHRFSLSLSGASAHTRGEETRYNGLSDISLRSAPFASRRHQRTTAIPTTRATYYQRLTLHDTHGRRVCDSLVDESDTWDFLLYAFGESARHFQALYREYACDLNDVAVDFSPKASTGAPSSIPSFTLFPHEPAPRRNALPREKQAVPAQRGSADETFLERMVRRGHVSCLFHQRLQQTLQVHRNSSSGDVTVRSRLSQLEARLSRDSKRVVQRFGRRLDGERRAALVVRGGCDVVLRRWNQRQCARGFIHAFSSIFQVVDQLQLPPCFAVPICVNLDDALGNRYTVLWMPPLADSQPIKPEEGTLLRSVELLLMAALDTPREFFEDDSVESTSSNISLLKHRLALYGSVTHEGGRDPMRPQGDTDVWERGAKLRPRLLYEGDREDSRIGRLPPPLWYMDPRECSATAVYFLPGADGRYYVLPSECLLSACFAHRLEFRFIDRLILDHEGRFERVLATLVALIVERSAVCQDLLNRADFVSQLLHNHGVRIRELRKVLHYWEQHVSREKSVGAVSPNRQTSSGKAVSPMDAQLLESVLARLRSEVVSRCLCSYVRQRVLKDSVDLEGRAPSVDWERRSGIRASDRHALGYDEGGARLCTDTRQLGDNLPTGSSSRQLFSVSTESEFLADDNMHGGAALLAQMANSAWSEFRRSPEFAADVLVPLMQSKFAYTTSPLWTMRCSSAQIISILEYQLGLRYDAVRDLFVNRDNDCTHGSWGSWSTGSRESAGRISLLAYMNSEPNIGGSFERPSPSWQKSATMSSRASLQIGGASTPCVVPVDGTNHRNGATSCSRVVRLSCCVSPAHSQIMKGYTAISRACLSAAKDASVECTEAFHFGAVCALYALFYARTACLHEPGRETRTALDACCNSATQQSLNDRYSETCMLFSSCMSQGIRRSNTGGRGEKAIQWRGDVPAMCLMTPKSCDLQLLYTLVFHPIIENNRVGAQTAAANDPDDGPISFLTAMRTWVRCLYVSVRNSRLPWIPPIDLGLIRVLVGERLRETEATVAKTLMDGEANETMACALLAVGRSVAGEQIEIVAWYLQRCGMGVVHHQDPPTWDDSLLESAAIYLLRLWQMDPSLAACLTTLLTYYISSHPKEDDDKRSTESRMPGDEESERRRHLYHLAVSIRAQGLRSGTAVDWDQWKRTDAMWVVRKWIPLAICDARSRTLATSSTTRCNLPEVTMHGEKSAKSVSVASVPTVEEIFALWDAPGPINVTERMQASETMLFLPGMPLYIVLRCLLASLPETGEHHTGDVLDRCVTATTEADEYTESVQMIGAMESGILTSFIDSAHEKLLDKSDYSFSLPTSVCENRNSSTTVEIIGRSDIFIPLPRKLEVMERSISSAERTYSYRMYEEKYATREYVAEPQRRLCEQ